MTNKTWFLTMIATLAVGAAACDAQNDGNYQGEPLTTVRGTIVNGDPSAIPPDAELAIVWTILVDGVDANGKPLPHSDSVAEKITVSPTFPSSFEFDVHLPPPPDAIRDVYGIDTPLAVGSLVVFKKGAVSSGALDEATFQANFLASADKVLLYVPQAVSGWATTYLGGVSAPGYYLMGTQIIEGDAGLQRYQECQATAPTPKLASTCGGGTTAAFNVAESDPESHPVTITLMTPPTKDPQ
jgi:hypothetical protein